MKLAEGNAVRLGRKLLQKALVKSKLFFRLICPAIDIAHLERHFHPARVGGELGQKQSSLADHRIVFVVGGVGVHQPGVQFSSLGRIGEAPVYLRQQFSGLGAMEVRNSKLVLTGIL